MVEKYSYSISLDKEESKVLMKKYKSRSELNAFLWNGTKQLHPHYVRAVVDSPISDQYLCLKVVAGTINGLGLGVKYLQSFIG